MTTALVALGGNVGDVPQTFRRASERLVSAAGLHGLRMSRLFSSQPMGANAGNVFVNAAIVLETSLDPISLLDLLQQVEREQGRVRTIHWGPRTLDLDLILFGDEVLETPRLIVPHPHCWYRRFVLDPACDVARELTHPRFNVTLNALRERMMRRPLRVTVIGVDPNVVNTSALHADFPGVELAGVAACNEPPPSEIQVRLNATAQHDFEIACPTPDDWESVVRDVLTAATSL